MAAFRSLFIANSSRAAEKHDHGPAYSMRQRLLQKMKGTRSKNSWEMVPGDEDKLPAIPSATLSRMKSFIRRNDRSDGTTTVVSALDLRKEDHEMRPMGESQIYVDDTVEVSSNQVSRSHQDLEMSSCCTNEC